MKVLVLIPPSRFAGNVARDLIYGCWCRGRRIAGTQFPPVTQLVVATALRRSGFDVELVDAPAQGTTIEQLKQKAAGAGAVIVLTSTTSINEDAAILCQMKAANPALRTIVFGGHPATRPRDTLAKDGIDIAVTGEPEFVLRDLVCRLDGKDGDWKQTPGTAFRENGNAVIVAACPFIANLDELPIPDYSMLAPGVDYFNPLVKRMPFTTMFTSRGCPGRCNFCTSPAYYGRKVRMMSAGRVLAEMRHVREVGFKEVFFRDEDFTSSRKRVVEVCSALSEMKLDLTWVCSSRVDYVDRELMKMMKEAGCHMIRFGVESGDDQILRNIEKGVTTEQTRQAFRWAHEVGMDTHAHCMIGCPGETEETIEKTLRFVLEIDPLTATFGIFTAYPGTPIFEKIAASHPEIGDGSGQDMSAIHTTGFFNETFCSLTGKQLGRAVRRVYGKFYVRPSYVLKWLRKIGSADELKRVTLAGTQILEFIMGRD